tara:strand:+ start:745 stop:1596 length:852 start_codon:yes stop_codon:yes gene_type:complete
MLKPTVVLGLFDGMSVGRLSFEQLGFKKIRYYSCEIDKYANQVSHNNFPDIYRMGDILNWKNWDIIWSSIDYVIGGSPCQGFSFAGLQLGLDDPRSVLFFTYIDILNHIRDVNPNVKFLLENVKMKKEHLNVINDYMGVKPIFINSELVSAQTRRRWYWTNWDNVQPNKVDVLVPDILETNPDIRNVTEKHKHHLLFGTDVPKKFSAINPIKAITMTARQYVSWTGNFISVGDSFRPFTPIECERLQTLPDNYTFGVSNAQRYKMLGNGWNLKTINHVIEQGS